MFSLYNLEALSNSHSFSLGKASSNFSNSSFSKACPPNSARSHHTATAWRTLSFLLHNSPTTFCIFFFFLQDLCYSSPCCGLRVFMQASSTAFRTLNHLRHLLLMHVPPPLSSHLPFSFSLTIIPLLHGVFPSWMDPRFLRVCRQQLSNPPSVFSVHSSFRSYLLQFFL